MQWDENRVDFYFIIYILRSDFKAGRAHPGSGSESSELEQQLKLEQSIRSSASNIQYRNMIKNNKRINETKTQV